MMLSSVGWRGEQCAVCSVQCGTCWWWCQVYYDEKEGEAETEAADRVGRVGGRDTFHEVGDVHVGN